MAASEVRTIQDVQTFIAAVALPSAPAVVRTRAPVAGSRRVDDSRAVTIGSQLTEFSSSVPVDLRSSISNCVLLAQLAANKATIDESNPGQWYRQYTQVLTNLGWIVERSDFQERAVAEQDADLHEAIIPVIAAFLGPQMAATSMIVSILNGLKAMEADNSWLTLFDRESRRFEAHHFQIGFADMDGAGQPRMSLICFQLVADKIVTQVLFFKFSDASATLRKMATTLTIDAARLARIKPDLEAKLSDYVPAFIQSIDI